MTPRSKKILKWTGYTLAPVAALTVALGAYIYSIHPKPVGSPPALQAELEGENARLRKRLEHAELIIAVQKKASELLGIPLESPDDEKT